jgi:hypothetical protein
MAYSDSATLKIFLSYASEDQNIANALKLALKTAFSNDIDIAMMSEFITGQNWRKIIQQSIRDTDVMIVIATGQLKPSHSFTGAEVGSFEQSIFGRPQMARWPKLSRLMIPFAVLARVPDTVDDYEGIELSLDNLREVRFEPTTLEENLRRLQSDGSDKSSSDSLKFLLDIQTLMDSRTENGVRSSMAELGDRINILKSIAGQLVKDVVSLILGRERDRQTPKAKLIVRTRPGGLPLGRVAAISDTTIELVGDFSNIFGPTLFSGRRYTWEELTANIEYDVAIQWRRALQTSISTNKDSVYLSDNSIISYDSKQLFRVFTSTIVTYYDNTLEYQIYAIAVLREQDLGDADTSLLLHAMELSLGYRSMFLEDRSRFSAGGFKATAPTDLISKTAEMIDLLVLLLLKSEQYGLNDPENILSILGTTSVDQVRKNYVIWDNAKHDLYACAKAIVAKGNMTLPDQELLIQTVENFCNKTREMNTFYTLAVIDKLQKILKDTSQKLLPAKSGDNVVALEEVGRK